MTFKPPSGSKNWLGLAALFGVAAAAAAPPGGENTPPHTAAAVNGWTVVEGAGHQNITLFPVVTANAADTSPFVTLDAALESGEAAITERDGKTIRRSALWARDEETPSVSTLALVNRGSKFLVLLAGEIVNGGKQDRVISTDRIIPPGVELPLDVFCVERGRWSAGSSFAAAKLMAHPSVRERAAVDREQQSVWAAVAQGSTARKRSAEAPPPAVSSSMLAQIASAEAPTGAYRRIYQSARVQSETSGFETELQRQFSKLSERLGGGRVVGVVVAYDGAPVWADLFASPQLFEKYWPKLLQSYVTEAVARSSGTTAASLEDARRFLDPVDGRETVESEPKAFRLRQVRTDTQSDVELYSIAPAEMLIHRLKIQRTNADQEPVRPQMLRRR
jgi:hypothetical protein